MIPIRSTLLLAAAVALGSPALADEPPRERGIGAAPERPADRSETKKDTAPTRTPEAPAKREADKAKETVPPKAEPPKTEPRKTEPPKTEPAKDTRVSEPRADGMRYDERTPSVELQKLDADGLAYIQRLLAAEGFYKGEIDGKYSSDIDLALREYAHRRGDRSPAREGYVSSRTLDDLGAGEEIAARWGTSGPRAPQLSPDEIWRMNYALWSGGFMEKRPSSAVDAETLAGLKRFQSITGFGSQRGEYIDRIWLYKLAVADQVSCPPPSDTTLPAGSRRESSSGGPGEDDRSFDRRFERREDRVEDRRFPLEERKTPR